MSPFSKRFSSGGILISSGSSAAFLDAVLEVFLSAVFFVSFFGETFLEVSFFGAAFFVSFLPISFLGAAFLAVSFLAGVSSFTCTGSGSGIGASFTGSASIPSFGLDLLNKDDILKAKSTLSAVSCAYRSDTGATNL